MKVPSPSQTRDSRIKQLVLIAETILEGGSQHLLIDKLERASFLLWPTLMEKTQREYAVAALKIVLSSLHSDSVLLETIEDAPGNAHANTRM